MALRWVRENIAAFGGDPTKITLMGHDTGAALVNFLLLAPYGKGKSRNDLPEQIFRNLESFVLDDSSATRELLGIANRTLLGRGVHRGIFDSFLTRFLDNSIYSKEKNQEIQRIVAFYGNEAKGGPRFQPYSDGTYQVYSTV